MDMQTGINLEVLR